MDKEQCHSGRTTFLNHLSKFVEDAQAKADLFFQNIGWTKEIKGQNPSLMQCPYDQNHNVKSENIENHIKICKLRKNGFKDIQLKDFQESSSFFYKSLSSVNQVFLGKDQFCSLGLAFNGSLDTKDEKHENTGQESLMPINQKVIVNERETTHERQVQSIEDKNPRKSNITQNPIEELKYIYYWDLISSDYKHLDINILEAKSIKAWLIENIPENQLSNVAGADIKLMEFIMDSLKVPDAHPDVLVKQLSDLFFNETPNFVLKLWKFLSASIIAKKHNISEVVRKEAEMLANRAKRGNVATKANPAPEMTQLSVPSLDSPSTEPESCLPVNLMMTYLTTEQRLKLYEYVVESGKSKGKTPAVTVEDIEKETEEQMIALMALEKDDEGRPRSHLEALAELRDYKRRRQTYRAKNQNSNRRSATDVLRELIDQQTKYLEIIGGKKITDDFANENREENVEDSAIAQEHTDDSSKDKRRERVDQEYSEYRKDRHRLSRDERSPRKRESSRDEYQRSDRDYKSDRGYKYDRRPGDERRRQSRDRSRERLQDQDRGKRYVDRERDRGRRSRDGSRDKERRGGRMDERETSGGGRYLDREREGYIDERSGIVKKRETDSSHKLVMKNENITERTDNSNVMSLENEISEGLKNIRYGRDDERKSLEGNFGVRSENLTQQNDAQTPIEIDQRDTTVRDATRNFADSLREEEASNTNEADVRRQNSTSSDDNENDDGRSRHKKSKHKHKHKKNKHKHKSKKRKYEHEEETV